MAVTDLQFSDGTRVRLSVGAPWWSWFWLGFIYQPSTGTVTVTRTTTQRVCHWWCLWLCCDNETVEASTNVESILIEARGFTSNAAGSQVTPQGQAQCSNCSSLTHYVQNFGFPAPPWAGGGGFQGIGFRATVRHGKEVLVLHDHWGSAGTMPADFL